MTINHSIWTVGNEPKALTVARMPSENQLEEMIVAQPEILSSEWMIIGRQETTTYGGRIDLLAIAPDGSLILIEIKRDRTPREVVAQAIDYASWVQSLQAEDVAAIYQRYSNGGSLSTAFRERFNTVLDEDVLNQSHEIIIVAAELDPSSERIVAYLSQHDIPINVITFQVFQSGDELLLSRAWFIDPVETQVNASSRADGPSQEWNGEYYVSYGTGNGTRSWDDAKEFSFISAGGGRWYSSKLGLLSEGDRIWVKEPAYGFVGVAEVTGTVQSAKDFKVKKDGREVPVLEAAVRGTYHSEFIDDEDKAEYFVPVKWLHTVPLDDAISEVGLFGNQNTVCQPKAPKWRHTTERLMQLFPIDR
ncbi:endonuclease NucS [Rhodospirillales bacterium]|nr:endonuclease NucS [Rhodospirillales bacterium]